MGKDIICNPYKQVYYDLPSESSNGTIEEELAQEDEDFLSDEANKEWSALELQTILLYLIIALLILFVGFVLLIFQMNKKKLEVIKQGINEPRVAIQSTELEAKT